MTQKFSKPPRFFSVMKKRYQTHESARRQVIARSNEALSRSKRAIFAMHRDDEDQQKKLLTEAEDLFALCDRQFRLNPELAYEGAYRAALEEYAEALLFSSFLKKRVFETSVPRVSDPHVYLAGLSDATGEVVRYAIREVTLGRYEAVFEAKQVVTGVIEFLLDLDLTGYLRTKFDQSRQNLRRLEEMTYDLALKDVGKYVSS